MYRLIFSLLTITGFVTSMHAQENKDINMKKTDSDRKVLVACFSATGTTARIAGKLADLTGGDLYAISPAEPYTSGDLDWNDPDSRSSEEMNDTKARPAISGKVENMQDYDTVFIGYPIWWNQAPRIINTFIENHDLQGKTLIPFATSGSSSINNSVAVLKKTYPSLDWKNGRLFNRAGEKEIQDWLNGLFKF